MPRIPRAEMDMRIEDRLPECYTADQVVAHPKFQQFLRICVGKGVFPPNVSMEEARNMLIQQPQLRDELEMVWDSLPVLTTPSSRGNFGLHAVGMRIRNLFESVEMWNNAKAKLIALGMIMPGDDSEEARNKIYTASIDLSAMVVSGMNYAIRKPLVTAGYRYVWQTLELTEAQLRAIDGIGPSLAGKYLSFLTENGLSRAIMRKRR